MNEIKNILICGIGAVGSIYANKINEYSQENLKILVDSKRYEKYVKSPKIFNGKELKLNYILPSAQDFKADLIIIATKYDGFESAVENISNFIKSETIILSLLNGVTSEKILCEKYGAQHVLLSYFIGHSAMRQENIITHDGIGTIVFGAKQKGLCDEKIEQENIKKVKEFFDKAHIEYQIPDDMYRALWLKFMLNVSANQPSAILKMTFGQMQSNEKFLKFMTKIMEEVRILAQKEGVKNTETMIDEAIKSFNQMSKNGKTSMLQDIEAGRKTEVEMFAGHIIKLGKKYNIPTPYNKVLKELIEIIS